MSNPTKNTAIKVNLSTPTPTPVPALDVDPAKLQEALAASQAPAKAEEAARSKEFQEALASQAAKPIIPAEILNESPLAKKEYSTYNSSRVSTQMITLTGRKIRFSKFLFITKDKDLIEYLDTEIALGCRDVTKGAMVASDNRDPMVALRAKHFEEFKEAQAKEAMNKALGLHKDMGTSGTGSGLNALSTSQVAV